MADKRLTLASWFLLALAAAFFGLIGVLVDWGGRIESTLLLLGKPVYIVVDAARPGIWSLFSLPVALAGAAIAVRKPRKTG